MKTSPPETNDSTRDTLALLTFALVTALAIVAGSIVIGGLAYLTS